MPTFPDVKSSIYWRTSHHSRFVVAYGSCVAWHLYLTSASAGSTVSVEASTSASVHLALPKPTCGIVFSCLSTGFSHSIFQNNRQLASHRPCDCPLKPVDKHEKTIPQV